VFKRYLSTFKAGLFKEILELHNQDRGQKDRRPRPEGSRAGMGFMGMGQPAPPHQLGGWGAL